MKTREQFYKENIDTIATLEDALFDLTKNMEIECGKQDFKEKLNMAWSLLYETYSENK